MGKIIKIQVISIQSTLFWYQNDRNEILIKTGDYFLL